LSYGLANINFKHSYVRKIYVLQDGCRSLLLLKINPWGVFCNTGKLQDPYAAFLMFVVVTVLDTKEWRWMFTGSLIGQWILLCFTSGCLQQLSREKSVECTRPQQHNGTTPLFICTLYDSHDTAILPPLNEIWKNSSIWRTTQCINTKLAPLCC